MSLPVEEEWRPVLNYEDRYDPVTNDLRRCAHCGDPIPWHAHKNAIYCCDVCRADARNAHRRAVTAWKRETKPLRQMHQMEGDGQLSLDPRPLPDLPPEPKR